MFIGTAHIVLLFLLAVPAAAIADTPRKPVPLVTVSGDQTCFVAMTPGKHRIEGDKVIVERSPVSTVYRLREDGSFQKLWQMKGGYSFGAHLSTDCQYLVIVENGFGGRKPTPDHFGVSFFARGKLLKKHRVTELVKDYSKLRHTVSSYIWLDHPRAAVFEDPRKYDYTAEKGFGFEDFRLKTVDGIRYVFDYKTGDIKEVSRP